MSLSAAMLEILMAEGLDGPALVRIAKAVEAREAEEKAERNAVKRAQSAERQRRFKARKRGGNADNADNAGNALPPNEYISNPQNSLSAKADCPSLAERVVEAWNAGPKANGATGATALDANRRKWLSLRVREHGEPAVFEAIRHLAASPFHCGTNERGWRANIGWMLKSPENFLKALEMEPDRPPGPASDLIAQAQNYQNRRQPIEIAA